MTERTVIRGDGYVNQRAVLTATFRDAALQPLNLENSTIYATFRPSIDPSDTTDAAAPMKCQIQFDAAGAVVGTAENFKLPAGGTAEEGVLEITASPALTGTLPANATLGFDVVVHKVGGDPITIPTVWTLKTQDSYTNRV